MIHWIDFLVESKAFQLFLMRVIALVVPVTFVRYCGKYGGPQHPSYCKPT